jgi:hypothetical protein
MKRVSLAALCLGSLFVASSAFADLRVMAGGGYLSLTNKDKWEDGEKAKFTGVGGSARVQYDVLSPIPGLSLFAGGGLGMMLPTYTTETSGVEYTLGYTETYIPVELGVQVGTIPMLRLQASAQYHYGLSGKNNVASDDDATQKALEKILPEWESSSRVMVTGRALLTVAPFVAAGVYADALVSGKSKMKDQDEEELGSGYEAGVTVALNF